jgi:hypothetical protein
MLEGGAAASEQGTRESLALNRRPEQIQFTCPFAVTNNCLDVQVIISWILINRRLDNNHLCATTFDLYLFGASSSD